MSVFYLFLCLYFAMSLCLFLHDALEVLLKKFGKISTKNNRFQYKIIYSVF